MATIVMDQKMYIDLPRPENETDDAEEREEVARVRVMDSARGPGELLGWLQYQAEDGELNLCEGYRLPDPGSDHLPDLGAWLVAHSGVDRRYWEDMLVSEDVWKAVIVRFL